MLTLILKFYNSPKSENGSRVNYLKKEKERKEKGKNGKMERKKKAICCERNNIAPIESDENAKIK